MKSNLRAGVILTYVTIFFQFITSILYTPFMLSSMGQQQYGLYSMGTALIGYLSLAELGFGNAVVRYASRYRAIGDKEKERSLYGLFQYIYLFLGAIVMIAGIIVAIYSDHFFTVSTGAEGYQQLRVIILILVCNLSFSFVTVVFSSIITAYERFTFIKITNIIYIILKPIVMIPLLLYGYKAIAMSIITLLLTVALHLANIVYVKRVLHIKFNMKCSNIDFAIIKEILSFSGLVFLASIAGTLTNSTDQIILGVTSGEMVVAVYSIAYTVIGYAQQFPAAISSVWYPRINMEVIKGNSVRNLSDLMISVGRLQTYVLVLIYGGFLIFGQEFIRLWAGPDYDLAYWIVLAILIPSAIPNVQSLGVQIIQATDKFSFKAKMDVICAIINVVFSIPAAIYFGALGCAACTGIAFVITQGFIMNWYYKHKMNLEIDLFWKEVGRMTLIFIPFILITFITSKLYVAQSWTVLICKIGVFSVLYGVLSFLLVMNSSEKKMIKNLLSKLMFWRHAM